MQSTNIGYHSDNLLLKIYEKNFFMYELNYYVAYLRILLK